MFNAVFCSLENLGPTMSHSHIASSFRSFLLFIFIIYDWPKIIRSVTFESEHRKSYVGKHIHGEYTGWNSFITPVVLVNVKVFPPLLLPPKTASLCRAGLPSS